MKYKFIASSFILLLSSSVCSYEIYLGDLHSHTIYSDGGKTKGIKNVDGKMDFNRDPKATPKFAFMHAKKSGAGDFLATTDHHSRPEKWGKPENNISIEEWQKTVKAAEAISDETFLAIAGIETSRPWGHMNTYNNIKLINAFEVHTAIDYYTLLKTTFPNTVSCFNHTNMYGKKSGDFNNFEQYSVDLDKSVSLFEVVSGKHIVEDEYQNALKKGWKIGAVGVSDTHSMDWLSGYGYRTGVFSKDLSKKHFYDALRNRRVYATQNRNLKLVFMINGALMGREIKSKEKTLDFCIVAYDPDKAESNKIKKLEVIGEDGKVLMKKNVDSQLVEYSFSSDHVSDYYYVKVENAKNQIAISSPIWVSKEKGKNYRDEVMFDGFTVKENQLIK